ncbi:hypothetical protein JCM1406_18190 [Clostridium novyi]
MFYIDFKFLLWYNYLKVNKRAFNSVRDTGKGRQRVFVFISI